MASQPRTLPADGGMLAPPNFGEIMPFIRDGSTEVTLTQRRLTATIAVPTELLCDTADAWYAGRHVAVSEFESRVIPERPNSAVPPEESTNDNA